MDNTLGTKTVVHFNSRERSELTSNLTSKKDSLIIN